MNKYDVVILASELYKALNAGVMSDVYEEDFIEKFKSMLGNMSDDAQLVIDEDENN
jgi:hypothetical protein